MTNVALLTPTDFFRTQVCEAQKSLKLELTPEVEFYVVNLLCDFINPAQLSIDKDFNVMDTPLALMLKKAVESGPDTQIKVLKRLGDTSLYFAGYFQDYFHRKTFDVSYYINMGSHAYEQTSNLFRSHKGDSHFAHIYQLLSQEFRKLVTILTEVAESLFLSRSQDLLETYNKWQQTHSEKLRRILEEKGVHPLYSDESRSMTAVRKLRPLIEYIEGELASVYQFSLDMRASDFLLQKDQMHGEEIHLPRASVFISEKGPDLELGIYLSETIIAALESGRPLEGLTMANLDAFCVLVEEISHFHLLVNRANKSQGVSRLELEWQGEMDKLWLAGVLLRAQTGASCLPQLASLIFENAQTTSHEAHYEHAVHHAKLYWKRLSLDGKSNTPESVKKELRHAYPLHWNHKLRLIHNR